MVEIIICGIYKITSPTGRVYIGQSKDIKNRWASYNRKNGAKRQKVLERSFIKHGAQNHTFEVVEECSEVDLNCRERYWQDFYDVLNGGLNCTLQECGEKLRTTEMCKKVYDTFYMVTYNSIKETQRETGVSLWHINSMLRNRSNSNRFVFKEDYDNNIFKKKKDCKYKRKVIDTETFVIFDNIRLASEIYNINSRTLKEYLDGVYENKTSLKYLNPEKERKKHMKGDKQVVDSSNGVIYNSISEASRATGINRCSLKGYLNGTSPNKTTLSYLL